jgi:hypothetical protein
MPPLAISPARRRARKAEDLIRNYEFPVHVRRKLEREAPDVPWAPIERGLREWLVCCAYRRRRPLSMPSRAVDYAWHAFILDTAAYRDFCEKAYGRYLDHFPEDSGVAGEPSSHETVWAWDRSTWSREGEATLWSLDDDLDLEDSWGLSSREVARARSGTGGGGHGGGCATGDAGSGGCGGGGCGGGGG